MKSFTLSRQSVPIQAILVTSLAFTGCGSAEDASPGSNDAGKVPNDARTTRTDGPASTSTVVCGGQTCELPAGPDSGMAGGLGGLGGLGAFAGMIQFCCTPQNTCGFDVSAFANIIPPGLLGDSGSTCFAAPSFEGGVPGFEGGVRPMRDAAASEASAPETGATDAGEAGSTDGSPASLDAASDGAASDGAASDDGGSD